MHGAGSSDHMSHNFSLSPGEYIDNVTGKSGPLVDSLQFHTNLDHVYGPYGGSRGEEFSVWGDQLNWISGTAGDSVDSLTFHFADC